MTLNDLKKIPVLQTRSIAHAAEDPETHDYIVDCLQRFYKGDYGEICEDDTQANNEDLKSGYGHILAAYPAAFKLEGRIYIEAHFDKDNLTDIDYTNLVIMYPDER